MRRGSQSHSPGHLGIVTQCACHFQRDDRVERVTQKVRIELCAQRLQRRLREILTKSRVAHCALRIAQRLFAPSPVPAHGGLRADHRAIHDNRQVAVLPKSECKSALHPKRLTRCGWRTAHRGIAFRGRAQCAMRNARGEVLVRPSASATCEITRICPAMTTALSGRCTATAPSTRPRSSRKQLPTETISSDHSPHACQISNCETNIPTVQTQDCSSMEPHGSQVWRPTRAIPRNQAVARACAQPRRDERKRMVHGRVQRWARRCGCGANGKFDRRSNQPGSGDVQPPSAGHCSITRPVMPSVRPLRPAETAWASASYATTVAHCSHAARSFR